MPSLPAHILVASLVASLCLGCTDRDRELAHKTGDGSDTFKYKAPENTPRPPTSNEKKPPPAKDLSDTFHYKADSRGFPSKPKPTGK
jgi:hypothetical protein